MGQRVHVFIAEPSPIIRNGVISVLKGISNIDIAEISDVTTLMAQISRYMPDILIVNPSYLGLFSLDMLRSKVGGAIKIIALQYTLLDEAITKQYDDVLSIYSSAEVVKEKLVGVISSSDKSIEKQGLSVREKEIVVCIVKGLTNKQIADQLCLSTHTVMTHRRNISNKLEIHSSSGLTIYAIVNKLVELDNIKSVISSDK